MKGRRSIRRLGVLCSAIILVLCLLLASCASPSSPSPSTSATSPAALKSSSPATSSPALPSATAPTTISKAVSSSVIKLRYAYQDPDTGWEAQHASVPWSKLVEQATNGRVQIEGYYAQTLTKGATAWEATKTGTADLAWIMFGYFPGLSPLADAMSLPFLPFKNAEQASGILWKLYEKYPSFQAQFKANKILLLYSMTPYFFITTKKQIKTMDDFKGMRIRVTGGPPTDVIKAFGGTPMTMSWADTYEALSKNTIDGMAAGWQGMVGTRQYELVKYYTFAPTWVGYYGIAMNNDKWNSLPKDIQDQIMNTAGGLKGSQFWGKNSYDSADAEIPAIFRKQGYPMNEYTIPQDELAKWKGAAGDPVWQKWIKDTKAAGYPEAEEVLSTLQDMIKTYSP